MVNYGLTCGTPARKSAENRHGDRLTFATRQRLIEAAGRRFYRDGFRMVGLDQILAEVGISKTAFYKHFESKDDLVLAALADHDREMQDTFRATDPRARRSDAASASSRW